jgi:uncharacterized surface anchored protein
MSRGRFVVSVATLLAISPLLAQSGRVRLRVIDPAGSVVAGAEVFSKTNDGKASESLRSDSTGEVVFAGLPMGDAAFVVSASGFKTQSLTVRLQPATRSRLMSASIWGR